MRQDLKVVCLGLAALLLVSAACADRTTLERAGRTAAARTDSNPEVSSQRRDNEDANAGATAKSQVERSNTGSASANRFSSPPSRSTDGGNEDLAIGAAEVIDNVPDRVGIGPGYTELTRAAVRGRGESVVFTIEVSSQLPRRMPAKNNLIVGIGVQESEDHSASAVIAQGTPTGWTAAFQGDDARPIDDWNVAGNRITFTIPWAWIGGPRQFEWGASLQLLDFGPNGGPTSDKAPNSGPQTFPQA